MHVDDLSANLDVVQRASREMSRSLRELARAATAVPPELRTAVAERIGPDLIELAQNACELVAVLAAQNEKGQN